MNKPMIKWFSMLLLLMVGTMSAVAQTIALDDFSIKAGETKDVAITVSEAVYGIQTDVTLSEGLTLVSAASAQDDLSFNMNEANKRIALLSLDGTQIAAGDAITLKVKAADTFETGTITLKNTYITTDNLGTEVKPADVTATVTLDQTPEPTPEYYIVGSMTDWAVDANYKMALNEEAGTEEYSFNMDLTTSDQFKVVKVDGSTQTWYPDGMGNNYGENGEITADGNYTIYFRPNYDGGDDWFYNCIFVASNDEPIAEATWTLAGSAESLFGEHWWFGEEASVNNMEKDDGHVWTKTYTNKLLTGIVYYGVFKNHGTDEYYPAGLNPEDLEGTAQQLTVDGIGYYDVTFTFNDETHALSAQATKKSDYTITSVVVNGNSSELFNGDLVLAETSAGVWTGTIEAKQLSAGTIQFGATINNEHVLNPTGSLTITEAGKYDVAFTYTVATNKITAEATLWVEQPETYAIVGELTGGWNDAGTEPDAAVMTLQDNGLYTYVVESFAAQAKTYQYKLRANNKWGVFELPASGNQEYTFNEAGNYKLTFTANVTGEAIDEVAAYTLTLLAEKIEEPQPEPDAEITSVQLQGDWNWQSGKEALTLEAGEANTYTGVLDLTDITGDQEFKLVVNGGGDESDGWKGWIGTNNLTVDAPENWVVATAETTNANCTLNNATTGYQTYTITATWTPSPDYAAGWTLKIEGKDVRPEVVPDDYTVSFVNSPEWDEVYAYAWSGEGDNVVEQLGAWPGTKMQIPVAAKAEGDETPAADVYTITFTAKTMPEFIIFNNGKEGEELEQTENLVFVDDKEYEITEPEEPATWTVAGAPQTVFGTLWNATDTNNDMVEQADGTFKWEKTELTLPAGNLEFKVVKNHTWEVAYPANNYVLNISESGIYTITITFNPEGNEVNAVATKTGNAEVEATYVVAGSLEAIFGTAWNGTDEANKMAKQDDGTYKKEYTDIVIPEGVTSFAYKIVKNGAEWIGDPANNGDNFVVSVNAGGTYNFTFTINPETNAVNCEAVRTDAPVEPDTWTIAGAQEILGSFWEPTDEANDMTSEDNTTWTLTKTGLFLAKGDYGYKVVKNHSWEVNYGTEPTEGNPDGNLYVTITEPGTYTVVFTFNSDTKALSAVATKTADYEVTSYNVVGSSVELFGEAWNPALNPMTKVSDGIYTWTKETVQLTAGDIEYKVAANGEWIVSYPEGGNNILGIPEDGLYNVVIKLDLTGAEPVVTAEAATATGIMRLQAEINNGDAVVYDLRGNRVRNVQRGIYIVNGRKQVVK